MIKSARNTAPMTLGGRPNDHAINAVAILAMIRQVIALAKCLDRVIIVIERLNYLSLY